MKRLLYSCTLLLFYFLFLTEAQATNLSTAAAALSPGQWVSFSTTNFTNGAVLRPSGGGSALEYQDRAQWNPINNTVMILGGAHGAPNVDSMQFAKLTDSNNTWSTLTEPIPTFDTSFGGFGAHTYEHDTIVPSTGDFYHRQYGTGRFMEFTHTTQTWSMCAENTGLNVGGTNVAGALMYFPERNSLVYLDGAWGVWELSLASGNCTSGTWTERAATVVANPPLQQLTGLFDYHNEGVYSAACACLIMGGGNGSNKLYKMDASLNFTAVATPPAAITQFKIPDASGGTIMTADPVSGNILVWKDTTASTTMYVLNPVANTWSTISRTALPFPSIDAGVNETVAIPISTYGVIMFVQVGSASGGSVWLYKHTVGTPDIIPPTNPSNLVATAVGSSQINLTWTASTDAVGVSAYLVERCAGTGCVNFVQVYSVATNAQNDTGLTASTIYRYRVRATDAAGNLSGYSAIATATTTAAGTDFATRCAAVGVVRCFSFDNAAAIGNNEWGADFGYFYNNSPAGACGLAGSSVHSCPVLDTAIKASGAGSLRFTIHGGGDAANSSQWYGNFSTNLTEKYGPGDTFWVGWRNRFSPEVLIPYIASDATPAANITPSATSGSAVTVTATASVFTGWAGQFIAAKDDSWVGTIVSETGNVATVRVIYPFPSTATIASGNWKLGSSKQWKQAMLNAGDNAGCSVGNTTNCTPSGGANELVPYNKSLYPFLEMYSSQGDVDPPVTPFAPFEESIAGGDLKLQNARATPFCLYSQQFTTPPTVFPPSGNCFQLVANEWMHFKVAVTLGPIVGRNYTASRVRLWGGREGQAAELLIDWNNQQIGAGSVVNLQKFGKVWLLLHMTGKTTNDTHPDGNVWYDDLIISRNDPGDPGALPPDTTNPTVAITSPIPPTSSSAISPIAVSGTAADDTGVTSVTWTCVACTVKGGTATGTASWVIPVLGLTAGANVVNVVSHDAAGNVSTAATLTITYTPNTTYWVRPTGTMSGCTASGTAPTTDAGYKSTITAGVNCMAAGNRLVIRAGTYNERLDEEAGGITYPRATSWAGASIIEAMAGETVTVLPTAQNGNAVLRVASTATNYYLWFMGHNRNFIIDGTNVTTGQSVTKIQAPFVRLDSMEIRNGQTQNGGNGVIVVDPSTGVEILNNNIHNNGIVGDVNGQSYGIYAQSPNTIITGNDIHDNTGYGIQIYKSGGTPTNNTFANNRVYNNGCTTNIGGVLIQGTSHKVYNNLIYSNCGRPLEAYFSGDETGTVFYNNTLYGNINSDFALFLNNGVTARNNISSNNAGALVANGTGSVTADHNLCSSVCGFGTSNVTDTAANTFVNAAAGNFHLGPNAFAKDQGVSTLGSPYNVDFDGLPRTSPWDIGAYEFVASGTSPVVTIVNPTSQPTLSVTQPLFSLGGTSNLP